MSYPSNSSMPNSVGPSQSGHYVVQPQAIQSAITTHLHKSARIDKSTHSDELNRLQAEWDAAYHAVVNGKMSDAEYNEAQRRIMDATTAYDKRTKEYRMRREAGQVEPSDFYKVYYGCTDEEADELVRDRRNLEGIKRANETRSRSRLLQHNRHGQGH